MSGMAAPRAAVEVDAYNPNVGFSLHAGNPQHPVAVLRDGPEAPLDRRIATVWLDPFGFVHGPLQPFGGNRPLAHAVRRMVREEQRLHDVLLREYSQKATKNSIQVAKAPGGVGGFA